METSTFASGLQRLLSLAGEAPTAIMCAEADPVHCHRRFIARQMAAAGYQVRHIGISGKPGNRQLLPADTHPT